jgi:serine/threonine protein kinase
MANERAQRRIERILDQIDAAEAAEDWQRVETLASDILDLDETNREALAYRRAAERRRSEAPSPSPDAEPSALVSQPTAFANGRYVVRRFLGEGGKKRVYLAHDSRLDRDVAFALIKTEGLDAASRERITREAQAMGRLGNHPNIVTVYDIGEEQEQPFLVLPVLEGGDIEGLIENASEHKLSLEQAIKLAAETCEGLAFLHSKGIVHRDVKPGNTWLTNDGRAMIGDFGLAVAVDRSRLTQAG